MVRGRHLIMLLFTIGHMEAGDFVIFYRHMHAHRCSVGLGLGLSKCPQSPLPSSIPALALKV